MLSSPNHRSNRAPRHRLAAAFLLGVLVALASLVDARPAGAATKKAAATAQRCDAVQGWNALLGAPSSFAAGAPLGLYVWNAKGTWVIAATGPDRRQRVFQGSVSFDAALSAKPVGLEGKSDVLAVGTNAASFTFKNFGRVDSISVNAPCATSITVTGTVDGVPLTPQQIFLGPTGTAPASVPAVIKRDLSSASSVTASSAPDPAACPTTAWPANTVGRPPAARLRRTTGVHLWNDKASGAWQLLAAADPGRPVLFEGRITANAPIVFQPVGLEGKDAVKVDGNSLVFSFRTGRAGDGFLFFAPCASQLTIDATVDGVALDDADLLIGAAAQPAPVMPFSITR